MEIDSSLSIRRIAPADWAAYRAMRLAALREAPDAFASRYAVEKAHGDEHWRQRVAKETDETVLPIFALRGVERIGLAWAVIDSGDTPVGQIFQMWVHPRHRGVGAGRLLIQHCLDWFASRRVETVALGVTTSNASAMALYQSMGFEAVGEAEVISDGRGLKEQRMVFRLV